MLPFTYRYGNVEVHRIFNSLSLENKSGWDWFPELHHKWWTPETIHFRSLINDLYVTKFDSLTNHYTDLRASMLASGMKNPIQLVTGYPRDHNLERMYEILHPHIPEQQAICTHRFGGSRLDCAIQLGWSEVPCIILDFNNKFTSFEELKNEQELKSKLADEHELFFDRGWIKPKVHSHISDPIGIHREANDAKLIRIRQSVFDEIRNELHEELLAAYKS